MKTIIRYSECISTKKIEPMVCKCCGAPMESDTRCEYCGTKYTYR